MSTKSAGLARKMGYTNVRVMLEGEPGWVKAGHPTYASSSFVSKGNIVLVDLRSVEKSTKARIPRSVTIPMADLEDTMDEIPMKAPVVLYSDNADEAMKALKMLRKEGFKKVSLVYGDLDRWLQPKSNPESGPVVTEINWKRIPAKGEVALADFQSAVEGTAKDVVILDVRTNDEVAEGMFMGAKHIPLDELSGRVQELPQDKKVFIHCSTGARAEMAAKELKKNGYKAYFLVTNVECEGNKCEMEE